MEVARSWKRPRPFENKPRDDDDDGGGDRMHHTKCIKHYRTLIGTPLLSAWHSTVTGSGRNGNKAVASAASKAFARRLHHRYAPVEPLSDGTYRFAAR